jgi:3'-phosphoadenosine 5'-phosphosulfate sulfotransferase (PAPS reductase)/FAD synthetase
MKYIVSVSGGKDSTALLLYALNNLQVNKEDEIVPVFCDTGWEHDDTYNYIDYLEEKLNIKIIKIQNEIGGMRELALHKNFMPNRVMRYCTEELKQKPFKKFVYENFVSKNIDFISLIGVRRDESKARADAECFKIVRETYNRKAFYIKTLQPIVYWSTERVFQYIKESGLEPNPLYKKEYSRVGCYPCIYANKGELEMLEGKYLARLRSLEKEVSEKLGKTAKFYPPNREKFLQDKQPKLFNIKGDENARKN